MATGQLIHYHAVTRPQLLADGSGHGTDGKGKHADNHDNSHGDRERKNEFQ